MDARVLLDRVQVVADADPSPLPGVADLFTIGLRDDGAILIAAATDSPVEWAAFLRDFLPVLVAAHPLVEQACGIKSAMFEATGIRPRGVDDE